ncbi:MAG: tail fiber domain-containing protein, partial [Fusobacteriaceae bacterium]
HTHTAAQVGLGNVANFGYSNAIGDNSIERYATTNMVAQVRAEKVSKGGDKMTGSLIVDNKNKLTSSSYFWTGSAIQTSSIEIINCHTTDNRTYPTLSLHQYGFGGAQIRMDGEAKILHFSSAGPNSAGAITDDNTGRYLTTMKINGNTIYHQGFKPNSTDVGLGNVSNWGSSSDIGANAWNQYATTSMVAQVRAELRGGILYGSNDTARYGANDMQYSNFSGSGGTGAHGAQLKNPHSDWFYHATFNHPNGNGYYVDLAMCFHSDTYSFRRVVSGADQGWAQIYTTKSKPSAADVGALPTGGGTMGGVIYTNHTSLMISNVTGMHFHSNSGLMGFLNSGGNWVHYVDGSGNFVAVGNVTAYSDIKLKKDITIIDNAMDKINSLNGYTYTRKDSGERHTGVIAQEVQKVLPEAIQVSKAMEGAEDQTDTLSVAYGNMVGLLIEGIKELKREIDELKSQLSK